MRLAILGLVFLTAAAAAQPPLFGAAHVVDGDTVEITGQKVRLLGLDAPEGRQVCQRGGRPWRCGDDAAATLRSLVVGQTVRCDVEGRDHYPRVLAVLGGRYGPRPGDGSTHCCPVPLRHGEGELGVWWG